MEFLKLLSIIFCFSTLLIFLLNKIKIPSILGFLLSGFILGPFGLGLLKDLETIKVIAEIGVILLLFTVGLEFSKEMIFSLKKKFLISGTAQFFITFLLVILILLISKIDIKIALSIAFLLSLSSTAVVFKLLLERGEIDTPQGKVMSSILLYQDLLVVPIMVIIPYLAGNKLPITDLIFKLSIAFAFIILLFFGLKNLFPKIFKEIAKTKQREIFILSIISFCFGVAYLTNLSGLSVALGAFIAGLVIAQSEFAHQAMSDILPFKESFLGIFFVSIGALLNFSFLIKNIFNVFIIIFGIFILKFLTGIVASLLSGTSFKYSIMVGLGIFQIGEFSFIIADQSLKLNIIGENIYQLFLISSIGTIFITPFIFKYYSDISNKIVSFNFIKKRLNYHKENIEKPSESLNNHIIIIGFGLNGRNLAFVLKEAKIPYVVLELNIDTVQSESKKGEPIYYGDGTSKDVLINLGIRKAKLIVIVISDPIAIRKIVSISRAENPDIYIIVRTRYIAETDELKKLGADEVIPEEFETSIEIFSRVLDVFKVPFNIILNYIEKIREGNYQMLRSLSLPKKTLNLSDEILKNIEFERYYIFENSKICGMSLKELNLRSKTGASILAIQKFEEIISNPPPEMVLQKEDLLILYGKVEELNRAIAYLNSFI